MNPSKRIAPSILSADFSRLAEEIRSVERAGADLIHVDIMDGHFVPNLTIGPIVVEAIRRVTRLSLDVHLMVERPDALIEEFIKAGANSLTVHVEASPHLHRTIQLIKHMGALAGAALNPATSLATVEEVLEEIDLLLVMSVNPGFGGQDFIPKVLEKIRTARRMIDARGLTTLLEVDGGIKTSNAKILSEAGVNIFVAGSAIFESQDYAKTITEMKRAVGCGDRI
ncbi:MAG TPA: ribulose-phosphate 3-epimerase [Nitrospiria bacterium]|nr:ribulose-phosphate 3-epimerase [Nitrospiria bacterium]